MNGGNAALTARIAGVGFWARGLPDWASACAYAHGGALAEPAPQKPSPQLLPANERRRAPETVAVALEVALAACQAAQCDPALLPSVFASTHGDLAITDYMAATLAEDPRAISPTRFHNSVHNAAAGYWTIGAGCMAPATALSAYDATFAESLLEALMQLHAGAPAVLLVAYDGNAPGPLQAISGTHGLLGGALLLSRDNAAGMHLRASLEDGEAAAGSGPLARHAAGNAMAPMLPLFDALAASAPLALLAAGPGRRLRLELTDE